MQSIIAGLAFLLLCACAPVARAPATPTAQHTPAPTIAPRSVPRTAPTDEVVGTLHAALQADAVVVQRIAVAYDTPTTLTIEFTLNEQIMATTQQDVGLMIVLERERSVHAMTRRVVAQVAAGARIDRVILLEHIGGLAAQASVVAVTDMQAWVAGALDDNQYHARWCCTPP